MSSIISLKKLQLGFDFYKKIFLISVLITVFLLAKVPIIAITALKFFFTFIIFVAYLDPKMKQQLIYYKNFGLSKAGLFSIALLIDSTLTIALFLATTLF